MAEETVYKPDTLEIEPVKIRKNSILNMNELYKEMKYWFDDWGYVFKEVEYVEKAGPLGGKNLEIHWLATKDISDYARYQIRVAFLILGMNSIEVQRGDRKLKLQKGDFEIRFFGQVVIDPTGKYEKNALTKVFKNFYSNVIARNRLVQYKTDLKEEFYGFIDFVKKYFAMFRL